MIVKVLRQSFLTVLGLLLLSAAALVRYQPQSLDLKTGQIILGFQGAKMGIPLSIVWLVPVVVLVAIILFTRTGRYLARAWTRSPFRLAATLAMLGVFVFTIMPMGDVGVTTVTYLSLATPGLTLVLAGAWTVLARSLVLLRPLANWLLHRIRPTAFLLLVSGLVLIITNLISGFVFRHIPHVMDSIDQVFQGRIFASGRVWLPPRFDDYFFSFFQVFNDGRRVFALQPFGHSLLLALGTVIRTEWLINPLLGSAEVVVLYFLGKETYDEKTGRIAALLGATSPFLLFMSSEYMNHASALFFLSLFLLFYVRTIRSERQGRGESRPIDPLLGGLCLAMALNIRPLSALAVSAPVAIHGAFLMFRSRTRLLRPFLLLALPVVLGIGAFALYNYLTTGAATLSGYEAYGMLQYRHTGFGVGFGDRGYPWWPGPHTPIRGVVQTASNLVALNQSLFEGPLPGLILVLLLFLALPRNPADYMFLALFVSLPAAYFFYFFQDLCFGPRFLYEGLAPLLLLSARGLIELPRYIDQVGTPGRRGRTSDVVLVAGVVSLAVTAGVGFPSLVRVYASSYWGVNSRVHNLIARNRIRNAVVFVRPASPPGWYGWCDYYGSGLLVNALDFNGPVVCARDHGDLNYLLMSQFPGRTFYRAGRDTIRQITNPDSLRFTPAIHALAECGRFVGEHRLADHRNILLPFREAGALVDTTGLRCWTYRNLDYVLFQDSSALAGSAPALGVFLADDENKYSPVFEPMRQGRDYVAGGCRFVLLFKTENGKCAVYDIRTGV